MKHLIPAVLLLLCTASIGLGREWQPFVGFSASGDIVTPFYHFGFHNSAFLPTDFAYAATVRAGMDFKSIRLYVGYHFEDAPVIRQQEHWYRFVFPDGSDTHYTLRKDYQWDVSWAEAGIRWEPYGDSKISVRPILGAAFAISKSRLYEHYTSLRMDDFPNGVPIAYNQSGSRRTSKTDLGIIGEFGVEVLVVQGLGLEIMGRLHRYEAEFDRLPTDTRHRNYVVLAPSFEAGATYTLPLH